MKGLAQSNTTVSIASTIGFISLFTSLWRSLASLSTGVKFVPFEDGILHSMPSVFTGCVDSQSICNSLNSSLVYTGCYGSKKPSKMHSTFKSKVGDAKISSSSTYPLLVTAEINFFSSFSPFGTEIKRQKCCWFQIIFSRGVQGRGKEVFKVSKIFHRTVHNTCTSTSRQIFTHEVSQRIPFSRKEWNRTRAVSHQNMSTKSLEAFQKNNLFFIISFIFHNSLPTINRCW